MSDASPGLHFCLYQHDPCMCINFSAYCIGKIFHESSLPMNCPLAEFQLRQLAVHLWCHIEQHSCPLLCSAVQCSYQPHFMTAASGKVPFRTGLTVSLAAWTEEEASWQLEALLNGARNELHPSKISHYTSSVSWHFGAETKQNNNNKTPLLEFIHLRYWNGMYLGASSTTFWFLLWMEHSLSFK